MKIQAGIVDINGTKYVPADSVQTQKAESVDGMEYVIVRTYSAGVHAGYMKSRDGKEIVLIKARRLWFWKGAATLSQLAMEGVKNPEECKFPCEVDSITLTEAIEVIPATAAAKESIDGVKIWKK